MVGSPLVVDAHRPARTAQRSGRRPPVNRSTRVCALIGSLSLACAGLVVTGSAAMADDPRCTVGTVSFTTTEPDGVTDAGLPSEVDFGPGTSYTETFNGASPVTGTAQPTFAGAQVSVDGRTTHSRDGFDWSDSPAPVTAGTSTSWTPDPADYTAGHTYAVDRGRTFATPSGGSGATCDFATETGVGSAFTAKGDTETSVRFVRRGSTLSVQLLTQQFVLADHRFEPRPEKVNLYSYEPSVGSYRDIQDGTTSRRGRITFQVTNPHRVLYYVSIPGSNVAASSVTPLLRG